MKRTFLLAIAIALISALFPAASYGADSCAYCGQYFFPGDTKPLGECLRLKKECLQVHETTEKAAACMCAVDKSAYMQFLVQQAKQRTAHMFASWAMPFMPGIHLIDPDLRKEFLDPDTPLHRKMEISLGRSTDLMTGGLGTALGSLSAASKLSDPNTSNKDKLMTILGQSLPHMKGGDKLNSAIKINQKVNELRQ